jgi:predicted Fe-Mo cluster-binding NifX family protein
MKIAIPTVDGLLSTHFGHCQFFTIVEVDPANKEIVKSEVLTPPAHEPGILPEWLGQQGCTVIIAGGMGMRAIDLFARNGAEVITGASGGRPEELVKQYLDGELVAEGNLCNESGHHGSGKCRGRRRPQTR